MHFLIPVVFLSAQAAPGPVAGIAAPENPTGMRALAPSPVIEIFVSQACKASPPAADAIAELAAESDVVALTWHVDYWNAMSGKKGVWRDPFSIELANARQRRYNERIRGRTMPITPQAVINGEISTIGNGIQAFGEDISPLVHAEVSAGANLMVAAPSAASAVAEGGVSKGDATLEVRRAEDGEIIATVTDNDTPYDAILVNFHPYTETLIEAGDNAGDVFREVNTVVGLAPLGVSVDGATSFRFAGPLDGQGCAVLVQEPGQGRIIAAQYCP